MFTERTEGHLRLYRGGGGGGGGGGEGGMRKPCQSG